jgi:hypothetical protein
MRFDVALFCTGPEPSAVPPRSKRGRRPAPAAEIVIGRSGEARNRRQTTKNGLKTAIQPIMVVWFKIRSRILGCLPTSAMRKIHHAKFAVLSV